MIQLGTCLDRVETWNPLRAAPSDEFCYIDLSAVDQDSKQIIGARRISCSEAPSRARQSVVSGDLLMSTVRPNLNGVARVTDELDGATASTGFCVLRANPRKLDKNYLFQWIKSTDFISDMVSKATGASYPAVSDRIIFESKIPLPPLPEQRRIAAILDQAETLRTQRRTALALLDTLTQSLFLDMFGDKSNCPRKPLASVCDLITDGTHYTPTYAETGVLFLSAKNVTSGRIDWERIKYIPEDLHIELQRRVSPKTGDVLMAKNGTTGVAAIVDRDCVFDIYVSLALLRPSFKVLTIFLHAALNSPSSKKQFNAHLKGIGVPNLHLKDIRQTHIPVPSLPLQQTFATRIAAIEALKSTHRAALAQLDALFASLQHRAFSGELTRSAATAVQTLPTAARSFNDMLQLDPAKGLEALVYVGKRTPKQDLYKALKTVYLADRHHLEHHGCFIYGETYNALPMGPVPQAAYEATKRLNQRVMFSPFDDDQLHAALRCTGDKLIALREADFSKLSETERKSLDRAISYFADMSFEQVKTASHDSAYDKTPANAPIAMQDLIASLPQKAQQQFFGGCA